MPRNKKPRKGYKPKLVWSAFVTTEEARQILDAIVMTGLEVELNLPRGNLDRDEAVWLVEFFHWISFMMAQCNSLRMRLDERAQTHLHEVINVIAGIMKDEVAGKRGWVCRASELRTIQEAFAYFKPPLDHMIKEEPGRAVLMFKRMRDFEHSQRAPEGITVGRIPRAKNLVPLKPVEIAP